MSDGDLKGFSDNPQALLTDNPTGGLPLTNRVRELAGSSSDAFQKIMTLAKTANDNQKSAIAAGLARVVYACGLVGSNPAQDYAASIQTSVAGFGDPAFASAFQEASKEINVASVGPGAGGLSVGGGATSDDGSPDGADNKYRSPGDGAKNTTSANYAVGDAFAVSPR